MEGLEVAVGAVWTKRKAGCLLAAWPQVEKWENSAIYLIREVRKRAQTDLFTSFEKRGNSLRSLGGGKLHLAAFNLRLLTSFNPTASFSVWRSK